MSLEYGRILRSYVVGWPAFYAVEPDVFEDLGVVAAHKTEEVA